MTKLIIHGGFPKSGSTTIQKSIERHEPDENVLVFKSSRLHKGNPTQASTHFQRAFSSNYSPKVDSTFTGDKAKAELRTFRESKAKTKVLSGEGLSNMARLDFDSAIEFLRPDHTEVRLVIRNPWEYQSAKFQQHLKAGVTRLKVPPLDYEERLATFSSHTTKLFSFEDLVRSGSIARTLLPEVGVNDADAQNRGLTQAGIAFLWRLHVVKSNQNYTLANKDVSVFRRIARELPGRKFRLHPDDCNISRAALPNYGYDWQEPNHAESDFWKIQDFFRPLERKVILDISQLLNQSSLGLAQLSANGLKILEYVIRFAESEIPIDLNLSAWSK